MSLSVSKDSFVASKDYEKVLWNATGALLDFDLNEAQDIARDWRDRLLTQLAENANLLGSGGRVTAAAGPRQVDVSAGIAVHGSKYIKVPAAAALLVYNSGTSAGQHTSTVYVDYVDEAVLPGTDADMLDVAFGESTHRLKRTVTIGVNIGVAGLPAPAVGHAVFELARVTHDFSLNGTLLSASDIVASASAVTPGELVGQGAARSLALTSGGPITTTAHLVDTKLARVAGALVEWRNAGVTKATLTHQGWLALGGAAAPAAPLDVAGDGAISGVLRVAGNVAWHAGNDGTGSGLDADMVDGMHVVDMDARYLRTLGGTLTGAVTTTSIVSGILANASDLLLAARVTGDTAQRFALAANGLMNWGPGGAAAQDVALRRLSAGMLEVSDSLTVVNRTKLTGNYLAAAPVAGAVTSTASLSVPAVGKRALVVYFKVDPGTYTGMYDINIYGDNNQVGTVLARYASATGAMEDRVPFFFLNSRADDVLYVQVTKATTGVSHTFTVTLSAERFA